MDRRVCLIVDDEPEIRTYLRAILQHKELEILEASNAIQALQIIHRNGGIDVVITDIQMAGDMDGLDMAHSVKLSHPALPVILISGSAIKAAVADGFTCILKPFLPETILEIIDDLLSSAAKAVRANRHGSRAS